MTDYRNSLKRLSEFDTPTICNAIEMFGIRPRHAGYMDGRIRAAFPDLPPMVGFASTATVRSGQGDSGEDTYTNLERQLRHIQSLSGPAVVVYQDIDDPAVGATVGDVMCSVYQACGAAGLITSGGGRDLAQVYARRFPLFMSTPLCSHAYCRTIDVGKPVNVGGLEVRSGDLLHGDGNGVTNIPLEILSELAHVAAAYTEAERPVIEYSQTGGPIDLAEMLDRRQVMGQSIAALQKSVAGRYGKDVQMRAVMGGDGMSIT